MSSFLDSYPDGLSASVQKLPAWIQAGCGDEVYYKCEEKGATFSTPKLGEVEADQALPDLTEHNNFVCDVLKAQPTLWDELKGLKTPLGTTLAHCIKTGIDNKGHPMIKTVGMVAGDEESYSVFAKLFDPVISDRHNGYAADAKHPTDMNPDNLSKTQIDPTGKYCLTTRCRTGRSIKGTLLPPTITFAMRREVEASVVKGLLNLEGELKGEYLPLVGNKSGVVATMPEGMSLEAEEELRKCGNLFQEPDSTLLLSSGCGRHWPDARGIYKNEGANFFVWVNEEDQMRIVSMQKGDSVVEIFKRFALACTAVQDVLKSEGKDFMHNDHLGYILTCPSNLGTGLRAGTMVKVPKFSAREDFKKVLGKMGLQARGTAGVDSASTGGTWDISNADRLGKSETHLVNIFIEGLAAIISWEQKLEAGEDVEELVAAYKIPEK